jgi:hypothetical protein
MSSLATIEPDSFYAATYILKFPRSYTNSRFFNLSIEATYSEIGRSEKHVGGATTSIVISPKPLVITIIAIIASLLGVILKVAIDSPKDSQTSFYTGVHSAFTGSSPISAVILALVFFNIYEFTSLGKNFRMSIGWRTALLIGILCGLFSDRIFIALKAFIGA